MAADTDRVRYRVTQHIPNFADGFTPKSDEVATLDELLALPWIRRFEGGFDGTQRPFVGWRRSENRLLALYGADEDAWWVVASAPMELLAPLPVWRISAKGQEKVDRWNRGDTT